MTTATVFLNDTFIAAENAKLHVADLSLQRGYAVFDFFRTVNGRPLFIDDHLERFFSSAAAMHLPVNKTKDELIRIVQQLVQQSSLSEVGIRLMLTGGLSPDTYTPASPNLLITCSPMKTATAADFESGYSVITYEHQRELPYIKSINYLTAVWLHPLLREKNADDVLYHNNGIITEFPRSNVFIVTKEKKLLTPARNMLKGITRKQVLSLAADELVTEERDIHLEEVFDAAEIFLTSTSKKLMPVVRIDNQVIGDGKPGVITKELYQRFLEKERNQ
jgi:D-alanine transaminase/branched-chain amino acid aminotransferase